VYVPVRSNPRLECKSRDSDNRRQESTPTRASGRAELRVRRVTPSPSGDAGHMTNRRLHDQQRSDVLLQHHNRKMTNDLVSDKEVRMWWRGDKMYLGCATAEYLRLYPELRWQTAGFSPSETM